jgi:hypothetical protein
MTSRQKKYHSYFKRVKALVKHARMLGFSIGKTALTTYPTGYPSKSAILREVKINLLKEVSVFCIFTQFPTESVSLQVFTSIIKFDSAEPAEMILALYCSENGVVTVLHNSLIQFVIKRKNYKTEQ